MRFGRKIIFSSTVPREALAWPSPRCVRSIPNRVGRLIDSTDLQIALDRGAIVIAVVSTDEKAQVVRGLLSEYKPADDLQVIVTSQLTPEKTVVDRVLEITENAGVQCVYDGVGKGM